MKSDIRYPGASKRVLFSSNKKDVINATVDVQTTDDCFDWKAYLRVRELQGIIANLSNSEL